MTIYTNLYINLLIEKSIKNKYTTCYIKIINNAINRSPNKKIAQLKTGQIIEKHHILPKCLNLGGEKDSKNYAFLTAKEHFICHKLLLKMFEGHFKYKLTEGMSIFFNNKNRKLKFSSRDYELLKICNGEAAKQRNKGNQNYKLRRPETEEDIEQKKIRSKKSRWINNEVTEMFTMDHEKLVNSGEFVYGRLKFSPEWIANIKKNLESGKIPGKTISEEHKLAMRVPKKEGSGEKVRLRMISLPKHECIHCNKSYDFLNFKKWHGEKCKKKGA